MPRYRGRRLRSEDAPMSEAIHRSGPGPHAVDRGTDCAE